MNQAEQRAAAKKFVERWKAEEGSEDRQARSFWIELCQEVLNIANATHVLDFERRVRGKTIDVFYEDMGILIENKSRGCDLDKQYERGRNEGGDARLVTPYQQARWYADNITPRSIAPKWIVTCNFDEIRIYDTDEEYPEKSFETIALEELPELVHRLSFFTHKENSRLEREKNLSVQAGEIVGRLYDELSSQYRNIDTDLAEQRSLNVLIVRLVFLLFAEDAGLLQEHQAFYKYLQSYEVEDMRMALRDLFAVLDTPEDERDPYMREKLRAFPYVNGGLFADDIIIPQFDEAARIDLLEHASAGFDWSKISPTIFGAVFESTLNPTTRRSGGMHYTSIENIHKVTGPLFYDALLDELTNIEGLRIEKERRFKLRAFQEKLASIKVLDPACGSGNFLTETYLSLRKLENRVIEDLQGDQISLGGDMNPVQVSIDQFYGIEINDFAVSVAKTALWIAELQMMEITQEISQVWLEPFPLKANDNIVEGNALRMNWNEVLPAEECDYVIGNPPFLGASNCSTGQKQEIVDLYGRIRLSNSLDYVSGWYFRACEYMNNNPSIRSAFVSTNSITQGEQVYPIWHTLMERFGAKICFAWRTFIWDSEATDMAHVHCVIIGLSCDPALTDTRQIFDANRVVRVKNISPYLVDAPNVLICSRSKTVMHAKKMVSGNKPSDGGNFILSENDYHVLIETEPEAGAYIRTYIGSTEFINGRKRYCLWLSGVSVDKIAEMPAVFERVERVKQFRLKSTAKSTRDKASTPNEFFFVAYTGEPYLLIPQVSSERRQYVPIGFMQPNVIASNLVSVIPNATLYDFGVMTSRIHNSWMRTVAGRLKSDYRYTASVVYNNFVWPGAYSKSDLTTPVEELVAPEQRGRIEQTAQAILDARANHPDATLADLYDPEKMPADLRAAHQANDAAVEAAYGVDFNGDEEKIVAHLFELYAQLTAE